MTADVFSAGLVWNIFSWLLLGTVMLKLLDALVWSSCPIFNRTYYILSYIYKNVEIIKNFPLHFPILYNINWEVSLYAWWVFRLSWSLWLPLYPTTGIPIYACDLLIGHVICVGYSGRWVFWSLGIQVVGYSGGESCQGTSSGQMLLVKIWSRDRSG